MALTVIHTIAELRSEIRRLRRRGGDIGFVPTMGYLHAGHLDLVRRARRDNAGVVVSIFVNPLQFGPAEDLSSYPRDLRRDIALLEAEGELIVFAPSPDEMYPRPMVTEVALPVLSQTLCGLSRPTHFSGVATVVLKLLWIVQPDRVYFGQKDGQQVAVVRRMLADLSVPVELCVVPTVREPDGLAMSSRNVYLSTEDRPSALSLHAALLAGRRLLERGERSPERIRDAMLQVFMQYPLAQLEYAEVVDALDLRPLSKAQGTVLLAVAARFGRARLIDNLMLTVTPEGVGDSIS